MPKKKITILPKAKEEDVEVARAAKVRKQAGQRKFEIDLQVVIVANAVPRRRAWVEAMREVVKLQMGIRANLISD